MNTPIDPRPSREMMRQHLEWLVAPVRYTRPDLRIEIACGPPVKGPCSAKTFRLDELYHAARFAFWCNCRGNNAYLGATLKHTDTPHVGRTGRHHAAVATCLPIDIDEQFGQVARRMGSIARPNLTVVTGTVPAIRAQLWIRVLPTDDLDLWSEANARAVHFCGGDTAALGRNRLMRLAGSVSYPSPGKVARGYQIELVNPHFLKAACYNLEELRQRLPAVKNVQPIGRVQLASPRRPSQRRRWSVPQLMSALNHLPPKYATEHHFWIRVGFALHDFDAGSVGLDIWRDFSRRCPTKADATDFDRIWLSFWRPYCGRKITVGWIGAHARLHGWRDQQSHWASALASSQ